MESLPPEIKALKRIKELLDKLMSDRATPVEIRSNALYECFTKDSQLRKIFPVQRTFNQFLRQQHDTSILKQLIPNYRVDTSDRLHYQWYFFRETNKKAGIGKGIETSDSKLAYKANELKVVSSDGQKFRSSQEKDIYERLLTCDYLSIDLEFPISKHGEKRYADFKILNRITQKTFYWEHFGMTNSSKYMDEMTKKLEWYRSNGFKTVENGGNVIFTIYSEPKAFQRDINKYITLIL
ncbi:hypothetical protein ABDJ41_20620 [Pedobacter sp. ASV1-7]|uniref:hypothetical protein n=1 Tax=Pedobacter sp. ASV1-7 TaxID=3145237 RepID=UPI0032E8E043